MTRDVLAHPHGDRGDQVLVSCVVSIQGESLTSLRTRPGGVLSQWVWPSVTHVGTMIHNYLES